MFPNALPTVNTSHFCLRMQSRTSTLLLLCTCFTTHRWAVLRLLWTRNLTSCLLTPVNILYLIIVSEPNVKILNKNYGHFKEDILTLCRGTIHEKVIVDQVVEKSLISYGHIKFLSWATWIQSTFCILRSILILSFHLCPSFQSVFCQVFRLKYVYMSHPLWVLSILPTKSYFICSP
jgi:hypothetical protein